VLGVIESPARDSFSVVEHNEGLACTGTTALEAVPRWVTGLLAGTPRRSATHFVGDPLLIGPEASWFRVPGAEPQNLRRRRTLRAIVGSLATLHREAPGATLSLDDLLAIGWPGERIMPCAAANRVYVAVTTLRNMGLRGRLILQRHGYLLDPALRVEHVTDYENAHL
jgi:hypothetical protein